MIEVEVEYPDHGPIGEEQQQEAKDQCAGHTRYGWTGRFRFFALSRGLPVRLSLRRGYSTLDPVAKGRNLILQRGNLP